MKKMFLLIIWAALLTGGVFAACSNDGDDAGTDSDVDGDSDTDNDTDTDTDSDSDTDPGGITIDSFAPSECLDSVSADEDNGDQTIALLDDGFGDLECVTWDLRDGGQLGLLIKGYSPSFCDSLSAPSVTLDAENEISITFDVGMQDCTCCYEMELAISEYGDGQDVIVSLATDYDGYNYTPETEWVVELPISTESHGTLCRYPEYGSPHCGQIPELHSICDLTDENGWTCPDGLDCVEPLAEHPIICMEPCVEDSDCSFDYLYCGDGGYCVFDEQL